MASLIRPPLPRCPLCSGRGEPQLPRRAVDWKGEARTDAPVRVFSDHIHGVRLGLTRAVRHFGKTAYGGAITSFCSLYSRVEYDEGVRADSRGHEIAPSIVCGAKDLEDPRMWGGVPCTDVRRTDEPQLPEQRHPAAPPLHGNGHCAVAYELGSGQVQKTQGSASSHVDLRSP